MAKAKTDKNKTAAELEAEVRGLQAELDSTVKDLQSRIDAKRELAEAARAREEEQARLEFNERFVEASKDVLAADCARDGKTVYDCVVDYMERHMDSIRAHARDESPRIIQTENDQAVRAVRAEADMIWAAPDDAAMARDAGMGPSPAGQPLEDLMANFLAEDGD